MEVAYDMIVDTVMRSIIALIVTAFEIKQGAMNWY